MRYLASCEKLCQIQRIMLKHFLCENEMRDFSVLGLPVKNNQHRLVFEIIVNCVWFFFFFHLWGFLVHFTHYTEKTKCTKMELLYLYISFILWSLWLIEVE